MVVPRNTSSRSKRLLIVVSSFYPAMLADMQRARMLCWELPKVGWRVEVLTPRATEVRQDVIERDASPFFPDNLRVHEVTSRARPIFNAVGMRSLAWRTLWPMYRVGYQLLKSGQFDLVYFSTTTFVFFILGRLWKQRTGVPYVLDFHDPWVRNVLTNSIERKSWKALLATKLATPLQSASVLDASGLVAVSPKYMTDLSGRFESFCPSWIKSNRHAVIPFGARGEDLIEAKRQMNPGVSDGGRTGLQVIYVGAGGPIMLRSFKTICRALAKLRTQLHPLLDKLRIELFGTVFGWKTGDKKHLEELASESGIGDLVKERPERVSYRRSLELLLQARGALVLGVDDIGYMPSKLFSYALSGKPLLASLRRSSPAYETFRRMPGLGHILWFDQDEEMSIADAAREVGAFLEELHARKSFDRDILLEPLLAPAMARRHAEVFNECLKSTP